MRSSSAVGALRTIESLRPSGRDTDQMVGDVLSDIARTLWPSKTAEHVASCSGCTVRAAERYLAGDREWSGDALAIIVAEILKRHGMRNARVVARR
jgi:hypothetical protein